VDGVAMPRAGGTARNIVHALGALYSYLLPRHDEIGHDPTLGIEKPRPSGTRERYAEPAEMEALMDALPHDLVLPYALAFLAGLRHGEIQSLPIDCIDLENGWIDVRYTLDPKAGFKGPKSGAGERSVPIFDSLRPYLVRQLAEICGPRVPSSSDQPGTLLLPSARKTRWGAQTLGTPFSVRSRDIWNACGLQPIGLHQARHSFATALVRAGYDVKLISEWIGHAQKRARRSTSTRSGLGGPSSPASLLFA
jgi:integrase